MITERRPRHYAFEIMSKPRGERSAALEEVPEHLREMVYDHCTQIQYHLNRGKSWAKDPQTGQVKRV